MAEADEERRKGRRAQRKSGPRKKARKAGESRSRGKPDGRRRASLIAAIAHPLRRRILRTIADAGKLSPVQVSRRLRFPLATVGYHTRVLRACGAVEPAGEQQVRGAIEHFYDTTIKDDPPIEALLEETREVDEEDG